jgi:hypothetical protein
MVDFKYSGPLLVRPFQLGGDGKSTVTLADLPSTDVIKQEPRVAVVPGLHTTGGGLYLDAVAPTAFWREWNGGLSTDSPGCFGLRWTETCSPSSSWSWSTQEHRQAAEPQRLP